MNNVRGAKDSVTSIVVPEGVEHIWADTFHNCTCLRQIRLPESLKSIWFNAFKDCVQLQSIRLPSGLTYCDPLAFYRCPVHLETITFNLPPSRVAFIIWVLTRRRHMPELPLWKIALYTLVRLDTRQTLNTLAKNREYAFDDIRCV